MSRPWHDWRPIPGEPPVRRVTRLLHWSAGLLAAARTSRDDGSIPGLELRDGLLWGPRVEIDLAGPGWGRGARVVRGFPRAIVWHYTATRWGTAKVICRRHRPPVDERPAGMSLACAHVYIEASGWIWQMMPAYWGAWHATYDTDEEPPDRPIDLGADGAWGANATAFAVELVGFGERFPRAQIVAAMRVARALVQAQGIPRELAGLRHSELNPARRSDPGPVFVREHLPEVLDYAYAA